MIAYKGYSGVFEYDPEIETFAGHVIDLRGEIYFEGRSIDELKASMARAVEHYLEACEKWGDDPERPFSGQLRLRMDPQLHRSVAIAASTAGKSLNTWIVEAIQGAAS